MKHVSRGTVKDGIMPINTHHQEGAEEEKKKLNIDCSSQFYLNLILTWHISLSLTFPFFD